MGTEPGEAETHRLQIGAERLLERALGGGVGAMAAGVAVAERRTALRFEPQALGAAGESRSGCFGGFYLPPPPVFLAPNFPAPNFLAPVLFGPDQAGRRGECDDRRGRGRQSGGVEGGALCQQGRDARNGTEKGTFFARRRGRTRIGGTGPRQACQRLQIGPQESGKRFETVHAAQYGACSGGGG
jgi:hypothetical protein